MISTPYEILPEDIQASLTQGQRRTIDAVWAVIQRRWAGGDGMERLEILDGAIQIVLGGVTLEDQGLHRDDTVIAAESARRRLVGGIVATVTVASTTRLTDKQLVAASGMSRTAVRRAAGRP